MGQMSVGHISCGSALFCDTTKEVDAGEFAFRRAGLLPALSSLGNVLTRSFSFVDYTGFAALLQKNGSSFVHAFIQV